MRDYTYRTDLGNLETLLNFARNKNFDIFTEEGSLNDFHVIYSNQKIKVDNIFPRKYIICYYVFETHWSNKLYVKFTDKFETVIKMAKNYGLNTDNLYKL